MSGGDLLEEPEFEPVIGALRVGRLLDVISIQADRLVARARCQNRSTRVPGDGPSGPRMTRQLCYEFDGGHDGRLDEGCSVSRGQDCEMGVEVVNADTVDPSLASEMDG